ncbi:DUF4258 domain-containing protein [Persicobacter psychrovividus]|uniref:DUF4258 domain-containing protein n=1 Tax=Persicobacter psychrovividus TaxID=387638 RepID=A0ABM7VME5_9BACT|nr:hypothetical protein PEPS_44610 [Persicobacter psychrovividus]
MISQMKNTMISPAIAITEHAKRRCQQRNIKITDLQAVVTYGNIKHRQGLRFYTVSRRDLPENINNKQADKLCRLVVVLDLVQAVVITTYFNDRPAKHVRKKGKRMRLDCVGATQQVNHLRHQYYRQAGLQKAC